jgi:small subunit ribosomal protein S13
MAVRIVGVDLPQNKRGEIALTYIFGIGRSAAKSILEKAGVDVNIKVKDWSDDQAAKVREVIGSDYKVEGDLRSEIQLNIKRLMDIGCYRGILTVSVSPCAVNQLKTTHVLAKVARKPLLTRRKLLNNNRLWQKRQSQQRRETLKLALMVNFTFIHLSTTSSCA